MKLLDNEKIKDIPGYEKKYAATTLGRIWSYPSKSGHLNGLWLKPGLRGKGYPAVVLRKVANRSIAVHRLILDTFLPNPDQQKFTQINHINGIKTDNRLENLEWCTPSYNMFHSYKDGKRKATDKVRTTASALIKKLRLGENRRLLTMEQARQIRKEHACSKDTKILAEKYSVGTHVIQRIINMETYLE